MHLQKRHIKCYAVTCTTIGGNTEQEDMGCMRMYILARLKNSSLFVERFHGSGHDEERKVC